MNEREIFTAASDRYSPEERKAYLDEACGDDLELRRRVEALLQSHEDAGSFLERPVLADESIFDSDPTTDTDRVPPSGDERPQDSAEAAEEVSLEFLEPCDSPDRLGKIGPYEVIEVIGRGGMGIVLRGYDSKLHRVVAVKLLAPVLASDATARRRFLREARAAAAVSHDHVVTIHAVEESDRLPGSLVRLPYLVMEYVSGRSLQEQIDDIGPLELREVLRIGTQIASGLAAAHAQGLVHRDIKPANILLENGVERVKITDFGLARAVDDMSMTQTGMVAGTPQYMAPEQARGHFVDHRADLFSLGCVMYAMSTGRSPFRAESTLAVIRRVCEDTPRPLQDVNPDTPDWLVEIIDKLLAKDPDDRFQSAAEVAELLGKHLAHVQQPSLVPKPVGLGTEATELVRQPARRVRGRGWAIAAALLLMLGGLAATEATGVTNVREFVTKVFRIRTSEGTLVVEVDDPEINVTIDGEEVTLKNVGAHEIRLSPGRHRLQTSKDGAPVRSEWITITRGGKQVVKVDFDRGAPPAESELHATGTTPQQVDSGTTPQQVESDTASEIMKLIPEASAMARQDMEKLARSPTAPKALEIVEKSLTLMLLALEPKDDNQAKEQFQLIAKGISRPTEIVQEIYSGREFPEGTKPGGLVTLIHADRITDFTCEADGDTATGAVSFEVPKLYQGKVNYLARRRNGKWEIEEFMMPAYDVHIVRDEKGIWIDKQWAITEVRQFEGHTRFIRGLAFFSDGQRAISASFDATLRVWNVDTGKELRRINTGGSGSIALSPDDKLVAAGIEGGEGFNLWDLESGEKVRTFQGHSARGYIGFSADGRRILSSSFDDFTARLWDVETGGQLCQFQVGKNPQSITFSADGQFAVGGDTDKNTRIWDAETGQTVAILETSDTDTTLRTTFSPDGRQVLTASSIGALRLWDVSTRKEIRRFNGHERPVIDVAFTADGRHVVSASIDRSLRLWETASGRELARIHAQTRRFNQLAVSPDGRYVIAGGGAGWISSGSKGRLVTDGDYAVHLYRLPELVLPTVEPAEEPDEASATGENTDAKPAAKPDAEPEAGPESAGPSETAPSPGADEPQPEEEAEKTPPSENPDSQPGASDPTAKLGDEAAAVPGEPATPPAEPETPSEPASPAETAP